MGKGSRRVELAPFYVLHHRPWRDTSRMLDIFARDQGRLTLFARGVRGPKSRSASLLQPFKLLLGSWTGSGDAGQLNQVEAAGLAPETAVTDSIVTTEQLQLPAASLISAWYLNELLLKLTVRNDPQPLVFDLYHSTVERLRGGAQVAQVLRRFEREFLELLGYGVEFGREARDGEALRDDAYYHFHPDLGFIEVTGEVPTAAFSGQYLRAIALDDYRDPAALEAARRILRMALDRALEGRDLSTRAVARAVSRRQHKETK